MAKMKTKRPLTTKLSVITALTNFIKTYKKRIFTSILLLLVGSLWMFIGASYLEPIFGNRPEWAAYSFMAINTIIFACCFYEIMNLKKDSKWPKWLQVSLFLVAIILLWFPLLKETFGPYIYNKYWFKTWMSFVLTLFFLAVFIAIASISKNNGSAGKTFGYRDVIFIFKWMLYLVITFKGLNFLMLTGIEAQTLGWSTLLYLFIIVMANDIGAFIGGTCYGKTPLAPHISPNKTWEGALTGLLTALVLAMATVALFLETSNYNPLLFYESLGSKALVYLAYFAASFVLSVISQSGDLLFSALKRHYDVKDFAHILPGHGGFLDRFDSYSAVLITGFIITLITVN